MSRSASGLPRLLLCVGLLAFAGIAHADWESARKAFQEGVKSPEWKVRRTAYSALADHDGQQAVTLALAALATETQGAVEASGVHVLSDMRSAPAKAALLAAYAKGKAQDRLRVLMVLSSWKGADVDAVLVEALATGPPQHATVAAAALGKAGRSGAGPALLKALTHEAWQVRAAAARSLGLLADRAAGAPLVERLAVEKGRARAEVITALEALSHLKLGDAPGKWAAWSSGGDPEKVDEKPVLPPTFFGIPITGERIVFVIDRSLKMAEPHPLAEAEQRPRLEALCTPPDGERIPWRQIKTRWQLTTAQAVHAVDGLPTSARFATIVYAGDVRSLADMKASLDHRWIPVSPAARKAFADAMKGVEVDDHIAIHDALDAALDWGGPTDDKAWKTGPDQILFLTNNLSNAGEVQDADAILASISYKARRRFVSVSTVGIGTHLYDLARNLARDTGGVYVDLTK